jgi:phosphocarrier protein
MTQTVEVADIEKVHKNPIAELVQTACRFESHIEIESAGKNINAKSLMGIMAFGLRQGMKVNISAVGSDEEQAVDCIKQFLAC